MKQERDPLGGDIRASIRQAVVELLASRGREMLQRAAEIALSDGNNKLPGGAELLRRKRLDLDPEPQCELLDLDDQDRHRQDDHGEN